MTSSMSEQTKHVSWSENGKDSHSPVPSKRKKKIKQENIIIITLAMTQETF